MEDQIPEDVVKDRFDRLLKEVQAIAAQVCSVHEGCVQTAWWKQRASMTILWSPDG